MHNPCSLYIGTVGERTAAIWVLPNNGIGHDEVANIADPRAGALWGLSVLESYPRAKYGCKVIWSEQGTIPLQVKAKLNVLRSQGWNIEFTQDHHRHLATRYLTRNGLPQSPKITPIFLPHGGYQYNGSIQSGGTFIPPTLSQFVLSYAPHFVERDLVAPEIAEYESVAEETD